MRVLPVSLFLSVALAVPTAAQQMGSANRDAPTVEQAIEFQNGNEIEISYLALNWAQGKFAERVKSSAEFRNFVNENAKANPVGKLELAGNATIGGKQVMAGDYGLHFLVTENGAWQMVLSHKKGEEVQMIVWDLELKATDVHKQRLSLVLSAAADADSCTIDLQFGNMAVSIPAKCEPAQKGEDEEGEEEEAEEEHEEK